MKRRKIQLKLPFNAREDLNSSDFLYNYSNITSVDHIVREHCWLFIDVVSSNKFFLAQCENMWSPKKWNLPRKAYRYSNFHVRVLRIFDFSVVNKQTASEEGEISSWNNWKSKSGGEIEMWPHIYLLSHFFIVSPTSFFFLISI